ncbi:MAG: alpha/beta fold hydrolase [Chryseotalea sp. WA131a]|jgi:pimeloyl-ACP methyl ester carboxylesterase|nr:MAG: alpha/beta fold hydrolase [Chryseotalea sp. WA131a]
MKLFFRQAGHGQPLLILHGLFGSSDNWYSLSKVFAEKYTVYTIDQRNHGQSPHSDDFNYKLLTEDLEAFMSENTIVNPIVIGHSMGGKTAMNLAIKNPNTIEKLIVVDIAPKAYPVHHDHILDGLAAIPLSSIQSRNEAEAILAEYVDEADVRQFLLKNLSRDSEGRFIWKINLAAIETHIEEIGAGMQYEGIFDKSTLFVKGAKSNYFKPGDDQLITSYFPQAKIETLNTGHWVQAEDPKGFVELVLRSLESRER